MNALIRYWNSFFYCTNVELCCSIAVPEFIDPAFAKTTPKRSFSVIHNERFGLVFAKTGSIISGTGWKNTHTGSQTSAIVFILHQTGISWREIKKFDGFFYSVAKDTQPHSKYAAKGQWEKVLLVIQTSYREASIQTETGSIRNTVLRDNSVQFLNLCNNVYSTRMYV